MSETIWELIIQQGAAPTVMAVFCYFTYKYLTGQIKTLLDRIEEKDRIILALHDKQLELSKLFLETSITLREELRDGVKIAMTIETKVEQILKGVHDIKHLKSN